MDVQEEKRLEERLRTIECTFTERQRMCAYYDSVSDPEIKKKIVYFCIFQTNEDVGTVASLTGRVQQFFSSKGTTTFNDTEFQHLAKAPDFAMAFCISAISGNMLENQTITQNRIEMCFESILNPQNGKNLSGKDVLNVFSRMNNIAELPESVYSPFFERFLNGFSGDEYEDMQCLASIYSSQFYGVDVALRRRVAEKISTMNLHLDQSGIIAKEMLDHPEALTDELKNYFINHIMNVFNVLKYDFLLQNINVDILQKKWIEKLYSIENIETEPEVQGAFSLLNNPSLPDCAVIPIVKLLLSPKNHCYVKFKNVSPAMLRHRQEILDLIKLTVRQRIKPSARKNPLDLIEFAFLMGAEKEFLMELALTAAKNVDNTAVISAIMSNIFMPSQQKRIISTLSVMEVPVHKDKASREYLEESIMESKDAYFYCGTIYKGLIRNNSDFITLCAFFANPYARKDRDIFDKLLGKVTPLMMYPKDDTDKTFEKMVKVASELLPNDSYMRLFEEYYNQNLKNYSHLALRASEIVYSYSCNATFTGNTNKDLFGNLFTKCLEYALQDIKSGNYQRGKMFIEKFQPDIDMIVQLPFGNEYLVTENVSETTDLYV